eukprot:3948726-Amphidinium_carterae.1
MPSCAWAPCPPRKRSSHYQAEVLKQTWHCWQRLLLLFVFGCLLIEVALSAVACVFNVYGQARRKTVLMEV